MYIEHFQVAKDVIPVRSYSDGTATWFEMVAPKASFTVAFTDEEELEAFSQWIKYADHKTFHDPNSLTQTERENLASQELKRVIEVKDERIRLLFDEVQTLKSKVKELEAEKEEKERKKREGSISSLEI